MSGRTCVWPDQQSSGNFSPTLQQNTATAEMSQDMIAHEQTSPPHDGRTTYLNPEEMSHPRLQIDSPFANHVSPSNTVSSEFLTADLASVRWLDLLAADAVQANRGFTRPSSPVLGQPPPENFEARVNDIAALNEENFNGTSERLASSEGYSWQLDNDIVLKNSEVSIFRNFVEHSSLWVSHSTKSVKSQFQNVDEYVAGYF